MSGPPASSAIETGAARGRLAIGSRSARLSDWPSAAASFAVGEAAHPSLAPAHPRPGEQLDGARVGAPRSSRARADVPDGHLLAAADRRLGVSHSDQPAGTGWARCIARGEGPAAADRPLQPAVTVRAGGRRRRRAAAVSPASSPSAQRQARRRRPRSPRRRRRRPAAGCAAGRRRRRRVSRRRRPGSPHRAASDELERGREAPAERDQVDGELVLACRPPAGPAGRAGRGDRLDLRLSPSIAVIDGPGAVRDPVREQRGGVPGAPRAPWTGTRERRPPTWRQPVERRRPRRPRRPRPRPRPGRWRPEAGTGRCRRRRLAGRRATPWPLSRAWTPPAAITPGQVPARHRQLAVVAAGAEHEGVGRDDRARPAAGSASSGAEPQSGAGPARRRRARRTRPARPGGSGSDRRPRSARAAAQPDGKARQSCCPRASSSGRRRLVGVAPVLAAGLRAGVDQDDRAGRRWAAVDRGGQPGRTGADDGQLGRRADWSSGHRPAQAASCAASVCEPHAVATGDQAGPLVGPSRRRSSRQSKQTPMPQNRPRGRPPRRVVRQERMPARSAPRPRCLPGTRGHRAARRR